MKTLITLLLISICSIAFGQRIPLEFKQSKNNLSHAIFSWGVNVKCLDFSIVGNDGKEIAFKEHGKEWKVVDGANPIDLCKSIEMLIEENKKLYSRLTKKDSLLNSFFGPHISKYYHTNHTLISEL